MRAGGCAVVQQALAAEAAGVVRQAVTLARRRGHAQVTPLHVASAMLSAAGLLRAACLRSHSHPLQCKALELCFNVALNRLPTAGPAAAAAIFHGHGHGGGQRAPALSNALVAAFKRAQAHQRRGGAAEAGAGQQQLAPAVLAAKVELEQLIVSILDDPSVSRVMREAGFSSSQVKANVEKAVSSSSSDHTTMTTTTTRSSPSPSSGHLRARRIDDGAMRVLDCMASGTKRCVVVVGDGAEAAVKAVMDRVSKAELLHRHRQEERLKSVHFVPLSVSSFQGMAREEVEAKAGELRALVREARAAGKGVALVLEDLAFAADAWAAASDKRRAAHGTHQQCYCPVEHAVMEVSSLVSGPGGGGGGGGGGRFWLLGFGSHPVFMRCRAGQPSLEAVWELHAVVVPDGGGLALSLSCSSEAAQATQQARSMMGWPFVNGAAAGESELTCCADQATPPPSIPSWLRRYQDPNLTGCGTNLQLQDLWNPVHDGSATHHTSELTLSFSPTSPAATSLATSYTHCYNTNMMMSPKPWQLEPRQPWPPNNGHGGPALAMAVEACDHHPLHGTNPSPESVSASTNSSDGGGGRAAGRPKFSELTAENLKILCDTLENRVPRHKDVATDVASTVLRCRSGMARLRPGRREKPSRSATWLLFQGRDGDGKKAMALELARVVFGSYAEFTSISATDFVPAHSDSTSGELTGKRQRSPDNEHGYTQRLYEEMRENPHRVVMIDDVEQLDHDSEIGIKKAIANGRIRGCNGDEVSLEDAIIVLSCEAFDLRSLSSSPWVKQRVIGGDGDDEDGGGVEKEMKSPYFNLDLNACADDGEAEEEGLLLDDVDISNAVDGVFLFRLAGDLLIH